MLYICNGLPNGNWLQKEYYMDLTKQECTRVHLSMQDTLSVVGGKLKLVILSLYCSGIKSGSGSFRANQVFPLASYQRNYRSWK